MLNQVTLIGRVGNAPEIRSLANGNNVANVSLATTEKWKDKAGEKQERTEWSRLVVFGKAADVVAEYVGKGDLLSVVGKLRTEEFEDKEGVSRKVTKVYVDNVILMPKSTKGTANGETKPAAQPAPAKAKQEETVDAFDDDIPF